MEAERLQREKDQAERMYKERLEGIKNFIAKFIKENQLLEDNYRWDDVLECFDQDEVRKFENWKTIVEEVYNKMKKIGPEDDSLQQQLPKIVQFDQKQALKSKLEKNQVYDQIASLILKNIYFNLQLDVILQYKQFYSDHKIITNNISHILPEEEDICVEQFKKWLKEGKSINETNFKDLKQATLIHHLVLKELYEQKLKVFEDESIIISTFQKYMVEKLNEKQISELLFIEDENLKEQLLTIFKFDQHDYFIIKNAMQSKNICLKFLDNKIETFINNVNDGNIAKGIEYLKQNYNQDPVLCMKILYYLSSQKQQQDEEEKKEEAQEEEMKKFNIQKRTTVEILKKKKYQILKLYKNKNIARVIQKGFLISKEENQNEAFKNQKIFEERQLFGNESDNNKIKKFLQDFFQKEEQNMRTSQKMNNTNQIFQELFKDSNMDVKLGDHEFIQTYMTEQEGYEKIMEYLGKKDKDENEKDLFTFYSNQDEENKDDANKTSQQSENDIENIAKYLKTPIIIHNIDNIDNDYKVYGENYFNNANGVNAVHIVIDNKNEAFHLLQSFDLKIKIDVVNSNVLQTFYPTIFQELLPWMKTFFGYKNLFKFIYDERQQISLIQNVSILDDFSKEYAKYKADNSDENFRQMQQHCQILENLHQSLFNEWYEYIKKDNSGKNFVEKYDFQRARQNTTNLVQKLKQIKDCFPDPSKLFDLRDFNRLSCRVDTDTLRQCLKEQKHQKNPLSLANEVITQMFGFINRRETISTFISVLRSIDLPVQVSSRFLISMLLQQSDISLRSRIIHYQSEYYSVPLIMNCQSSYLGCNQQIRYVPEIAFNMLEGFGVFNFGAGNRTIMPVGKSQVANDLLFPSSLFNHEVFEQQDKNLFSAGQIDVFFEKSFDKKRNIVMMDGQGGLKDQAITSALILTNIAIIHFQNKDFQDQESLNDLMKKIKMIKNMKNNIKIILIVRDAQESKVIKPDFENKNQQIIISQHYPNAKYFEKDIDFCIELYNMGSLSKIDRIKEVKTISKIFYELIEQMNKEKQAFHFTKQNFLNKFIKKDTTDQSFANDVIKINEKAEQFMKKVELIKDNIFDEKSLPILKYKNLLRNKIVEIRQNKGLDNVQDQQDLEEKLDNQKNEIELKLRQLAPSKVLEEFLDIVNHPNNSMILQEISKKLRILTQQNTEEPKKRKEKLIDDQKANTKDQQIQSKDEIDKRNNEFKNKIEQIDIEIYQKSISLEYFWRCLVFYLGKEPQFQKYNCPNVKDDVVRNIENQLKNGDCFELIDGENLEFKGLFIQEVIKQNKKDKVIVVCVIGPQSTGKSTLMNFAFGTQFFTSAGRCTKGIYFTLQKIPDTCQDNQISWLLMLDTEGLQSPERIDDEYDRKIVLFAMLSADVLIINSKGEINANMINTLKMCCVTYDALQKYGYTPEIIYTNGQNDRLDKGPFKDQVQELKSKVIEASDSPTIEKVAEQLLGYNDDKIQVFGYAYKSEVIEKDNEKGLKYDYNFKISNTNFGVETARIYNIIQKVMNDPNKGFREINMWLEESKENWSVIDRFSASINKFSNLEEFRNDKKVSKYLNEKWIEYISKNSILQKDDDKCVQEKQRLIQIFQQFGQETLDQEIHKVEQDNIKEKDIDLEKEVFQYFDEWKQLPLQRGITVLSEKNHKSNIRAKMDVIQNEFKIKLRSKIKEEQMLIINQNGHRKVLNRAYKLSNDENFKKINQNDKIKELQKEFNDAWKQSLDEIRGEAQIEQMKKSYFDDLQRTFKIFNPFIEHKGETQFKQLLFKVEETHKNNQQDNSLMQNLLLNILTGIEQNQQVRQFFTFSQDVLLQMVENPRDRLFDFEKNPEIYLNLNHLLTCDYTYHICTDLQKDLDKQLLIKNMYYNLTNQIQKIKSLKRKNYYGDTYEEKCMIWVNDEIGQKSYLQLLFQDLQKAQFKIKTSVRGKMYFNNEEKIQKLSDLSINEIFNEFNHDDFSQMNNLKYKWIIKFVENLIFDCDKKDKKNKFFIEDRIAVYFNSKPILILNQESPHFTTEDHQKINKELYDASIILPPQISYNVIKKEEKKFSKTSIMILLQPRSSPYDAVTKWQYLSYIAYKQINWLQIVQKIMQSVDTVLKPQFAAGNTQNIIQSLIDEKKQGTQEIDFEKIMKLTQMDYHQISNLEAEHLNTNLREKIDYELYTKLGLFLNHYSKANISWCALIYSWVKLYKKAETTFNIQLNQLESQKDKYWKEFQEIASGSSDLLTSQSAKTLMNELDRKYYESIKSKESVNVSDKLSQLKFVFDNYKVYEYLDNKYLIPPQNFVYDEFLQYVHDPVPIFVKHAEELKQQRITDQLIVPQSAIVQNEIQKNISTLLKILNKLNQVVINANCSQNNNSIENYFQIRNHNNQQLLNYEQQSQLSKNVFSVVNFIMRRLLQGEFAMNEFEFKIYDEKKVESFYLFQPKKRIDGGLLEIFSQNNLQKEIKEIYQQDKSSNQLVEMLIRILELNQYESNCRMFQINVMIHEMQKKAEEMQKNLDLSKGFDETWFGCVGQIDVMMKAAVGCGTRCQYCGRKCELQQHQIDQEHTCNKMGHQMRVFKGGYLVNDKNEKYPSLRTCDMIKPDTKIYIDDIQQTWQDLLDKQAVKWKVSYKADDKDLLKKYEAFNQFWYYVGKQYCDNLKISHVNKNDEIDEQAQMHDSAVVVICIDMSGSMSGSRWNNAVRGAKQLIEFIKKHHLDKGKVQLVIILFDDNSKVVYDKNIGEQVPESIWQPDYGGTDFGNPMKDAIRLISKYIAEKDSAKIYFFTDGFAPYPEPILNQIQADIQSQKKNWQQNGGRNKFECLLMCENTKNATMELIKNKFNNISQSLFGHDNCCKLMEAVDTSKLGSVMIENFKTK